MVSFAIPNGGTIHQRPAPENHQSSQQASSSRSERRLSLTHGFPFLEGRNHAEAALATWPAPKLYLGLFEVIVYLPSGTSTIWGIYSEYIIFWGETLEKIQAISWFRSPSNYMYPHSIVVLVVTKRLNYRKRVAHLVVKSVFDWFNWFHPVFKKAERCTSGCIRTFSEGNYCSAPLAVYLAAESLSFCYISGRTWKNYVEAVHKNVGKLISKDCPCINM